MKRLNLRLERYIDMPFLGARRPLRARLLWGVLSLVLLVFGPSGAVLAQESGLSSDSQCQELEAVADGASEPEQIEHNGTVGMFFPMATARLILCEVGELRLRRQEAAVDIRLIDSWRLQVRLLERQLSVSRQTREAFEGIVERSERRAREAEGRTDAWYRAPAFLISLGVVLTVGLYFAASYGIRSLALD